MAKVKTSGEKTATISAVANSAAALQRAIVSPVPVTACCLVGFVVSTGKVFQRSFPNPEIAAQWASSPDGADIEVTRIDPMQTFVG